MARPAARRGARRSRARGLLLLAAAAAVAVVVVVAAAAAAGEEERHQQQQQQPGGTFEFNLPGHGNVKASWSVADDEESRWLAAWPPTPSRRRRLSSVKFGSDAYEFIADLLRQGTDDGEGEKPTGYWEKVDEEGSRMLDRIAANARHRAEANGDDDIGGFVHNVFSGKSKQHGEEPSHVESDKEFSNSKLPPHDDIVDPWCQLSTAQQEVGRKPIY
uniref:Uncharacterized protein n=1 Tax=Oryza barthii TaxID=65489 RepID=A0A0D3G6R1_9ORYZ